MAEYNGYVTNLLLIAVIFLLTRPHDSVLKVFETLAIVTAAYAWGWVVYKAAIKERAANGSN